MKKFEVKLIVEAESKEKVQELFPMYKLQIEQLRSRRSLNQNSALHLWLTQLEEEMKVNGITMDMIITKPQEIPITRHLLKDLFRLLCKKMYHKESTADINSLEFYEVQKVFEKNIGEKTQIYIPFPSEERMMEEELN
jgi:hypothetical protein